MNRDGKANKGINQLKSLGLAVTTFFAVFVLVNVVYIGWAVRAYPENNSMAGLPAFMYGFIFGSFAALAVFLITYRRFRRETKVNDTSQPPT